MRRQLSTDGKQEFRTGMDTYKEWQKKDGRRVRIDICHKMNEKKTLDRWETRIQNLHGHIQRMTEERWSNSVIN